MKLYHASRISGIKVLKPFPHPAVNGESVVFAIEDPIFALAMTYGSGEVIAVGYFIDKKSGKKEFYIDELERGALKLLEKPASLYIIDSELFVHDSRIMDEELISMERVPVIEEIRFDNVLEELTKRNVNIVPYERVLSTMKQRGKSPDLPEKEHSTTRFGKIKK